MVILSGGLRTVFCVLQSLK